MRFLTFEQTRDWVHRYGATADDGKPLIHTDTNPATQLDIVGVRDMNHYWVSHRLVALVQPFERCLLWVTQTDIWGTRQNLHLYYTLRRACGDLRLIEEAPGHLALPHEAHELVSYVFLGLLSGWDMYLTSTEDYGRVFVSHDEWMLVRTSNRSVLDEVAATLAALK